MKQFLPHSTNRIAALTGAILMLGAANVLPGLLAQDSQTPPERDLTSRADTPGTTSPPVRTRTVRGAPGESISLPASERMPSRSPAPALRPPTEVAPARFEVTVYEVHVPGTRIAELEAPPLEARAATVQDLAKALGEFGDTKLLYRIDQTVNLYGEHITLGTREPMVTGARQMGSGPAINTISYQEVGLIVSLAASPPAPDAPRRELGVQVNFELSALADSGVEIAPSVKAPRIRNLQLSHSETPRFGKPVVLLNVSASPGGDAAPPTAYVIRYVFREVKP